MIPLACPHCRAPLDDSHCPACARTFPTLRGIPDLRTAEDAYLPNADDRAFADRLDADFDRLDSRGLLGRYFDLCPETPPDLRDRQVAHILSAPDRAAGWVDAIGPGLPDGPWLDLGCGSGSFLASGAGRGRELVGLDVALRWLLVARKRLDEDGLSRVRLACGNAERLPFADRTFAAVIAGDVIEHVADPVATIAEAYRVLRPGGRFFLATPNRFSLAPEPHVGVWGVGFLPRPWMAPYVAAVRGVDFRAIRTLSYVGWSRLFRESPFRGASIVPPTLPAADLATMGRLKRTLATAYNRAVATPPGGVIARAVGPLFHIVATRPPDLPTPTPPRSTTPPA